MVWASSPTPAPGHRTLSFRGEILENYACPQSRADELAEARAADSESSADRAAREAVVRRLDNERQYLKSQLQSEITCRDELREALATATRQLGEVKVRNLGKN